MYTQKAQRLETRYHHAAICGLVWASNPMFHVGDDAEEVTKDVVTLTLVEFARKYTHSDFVKE